MQRNDKNNRKAIERDLPIITILLAPPAASASNAGILLARPDKRVGWGGGGEAHVRVYG